jgi:hypothetical protein
MRLIPVRRASRCRAVVTLAPSFITRGPGISLRIGSVLTSGMVAPDVARQPAMIVTAKTTEVQRMEGK